MIKKLPNEYLNFIEKCRTKNYIGPMHNHHIIPKFMGGDNSKDNLILLSVDDHLNAHLILAETISDEYKKNAWNSVVILKKGWGKNADSILLELHKNNIGELNHFFGKTHTKETKQKIAESHPYTTRGKRWQDVFGKDRAIELGKKISKTKIGSKNPSYGKMWIHNPQTGEIKYITKNNTIPIEWSMGMGKRKDNGKGI